MNPPQAEITRDEIILVYRKNGSDAETIKAEFDKNLTQIQEYLQTIKNDVAQYNQSINSLVKTRIEARKAKLLEDQGLVAALGYPLRKRADAPHTYIVPDIRRKASVHRPKASMDPFVPEPALDMNEYEHILSVISNMITVIERSPDAFREMKEEDLRQHFLVQLNAQYEGKATGETFNFKGKTDILIREGGRNIFIAECKYWKGSKSLISAIDQLLNYSTWRDTKIALLIFNKSKNFSKLLEEIPDTVKRHPNYKRQEEYKSETGFRFKIHHMDDVNRELILTILAFEIPN